MKLGTLQKVLDKFKTEFTRRDWEELKIDVYDSYDGNGNGIFLVLGVLPEDQREFSVDFETNRVEVTDKDGELVYKEPIIEYLLDESVPKQRTLEERISLLEQAVAKNIEQVARLLNFMDIMVSENMKFQTKQTPPEIKLKRRTPTVYG